jgi:hypothetical protein
MLAEGFRCYYVGAVRASQLRPLCALLPLYSGILVPLTGLAGKQRVRLEYAAGTSRWGGSF